jgi:hypothetical protein
MKRMPLLPLLLCLLLCSCATPTFQPYYGNAVRHGTGGTMIAVNGMDVWTNGDPPRSYKILGVIEEEGGRHATTGTVEEDLVKVARTSGADALIVMGAERRPAGFVYGSGYGAFVSRPNVRTVAIKYL